MEEKYYPGSSYQNLFDYLTKEHGLTLLESQMNDLINVVHKFHPVGASPTINHDRVIANQVAGMPLEEAIFQDGYSAGVEFEKKRAQRGALLPAADAVQNWFEENIDKECSASSAVYKFRLWLESLQREFLAKRQQAIGLGLIEDESPAAARDEDAVEFAEWIELEGMWQGKHDKKWRRWTNELIANTTAQLYELFKQQKNP